MFTHNSWYLYDDFFFYFLYFYLYIFGVLILYESILILIHIIYQPFHPFFVYCFLCIL